MIWAWSRSRYLASHSVGSIFRLENRSSPQAWNGPKELRTPSSLFNVWNQKCCPILTTSFWGWVVGISLPRGYSPIRRGGKPTKPSISIFSFQQHRSILRQGRRKPPQPEALRQKEPHFDNLSAYFLPGFYRQLDSQTSCPNLGWSRWSRWQMRRLVDQKLPR